MERVGQKKISFMKCIFSTLHYKIVNPKFEKETATGQLSLPYGGDKENAFCDIRVALQRGMSYTAISYFC